MCVCVCVCVCVCELSPLSSITHTYTYIQVRESNSLDGFLALSILRATGVFTHSLIEGTRGNWWVKSTLEGTLYAPTIASLLDKLRHAHVIVRPAVCGASGGSGACFKCAAPLTGLTVFCPECGTRVRSTREEIESYGRLAPMSHYNPEFM